MLDALFAFLLFGGSHTSVHLDRGKVDNWRYEVRTDSLAGTVRCKLKGRDAASHLPLTFVGGAVMVQFGHWMDTRSAVYRVDGGAPHRPVDDVNALAVSHTWTPAQDLDQSPHGMVFIPADLIQNAHQAVVRPENGEVERTVSFDGLDAARAALQAKGCTPADYAQVPIAE